MFDIAAPHTNPSLFLTSRRFGTCGRFIRRPHHALGWGSLPQLERSRESSKGFLVEFILSETEGLEMTRGGGIRRDVVRYEGMDSLEIAVQRLSDCRKKTSAHNIAFMCHFEPPGGGEKSLIKINYRYHGLGMFSDQRMDNRFGLEEVRFPEIGTKTRS